MPVKICAESEIKEDSMQRFVVGKKEVLVGRKNGRLFACDNVCPHRYASLHKGYYKGDNLVCHMHRYEFDVCSGKLENMQSWKKSSTWVEQNSEWRKSGDLIMYDVKVTDGAVYVELGE